MNKFKQLISSNGSDVLKRRADQIVSAAEIAQQNLVNMYKQKKTELELKIADLTDLAPESSDSLRPGAKDWDAQQWAVNLQAAKTELYSIEINLKIAQETYEEYFQDNDAAGQSK